MALASVARPTITGPDITDTFTTAFAHWGTPVSVLTDNGAIFTPTPPRGGRTTLQIMPGELVINDISSRPYHPQPCGKVERFHQTLKRHLTAIIDWVRANPWYVKGPARDQP